MRDKNGVYPFKKYWVVPCVTVVIGLVLTCVATVPSGHVGVEMQFSAVTGNYKTQGLQFKSPIVKFHNMSIQTQKYEAPATAVSNDLQTVNTVITVDYHLSSDFAPEVYRDIGDNYINTIAVQAIQETVKQVTAEFKAEDLIKRRPEVKALIFEALYNRLTTRGIEVETVSLTDFQFSAVFDAAIEAKVVAEQKVLEATNKLEQVKVEAQQREEQARGEANALIAGAEGEAKSIEIVTAAKVQANMDLQETLTPEVLKYLLINELGDNIKVIMIPEGQGLDLLMPDIED
ncbi:MAG: prohibitin family protein [Dehalococcoidales bacterium]|nr:prohibitin family protein [Dehalococcoidales bacterium]